MPEGVYKIVVSSPENNRKYSLAIGEIEKFGWAETVESYASIPKIKRDFFNTSPISFIFSPLGYGLIIVMFLLSFIFGLVYRWLLKKIFPRTDRAVNRNIKLNGRRLRAACGVILFGIAITTSRSPWLLFAS